MIMERAFDPAAEIQKLRDHFASHDKCIVFLFGAGTSVVSGNDGDPLVPAVAALTGRCKEIVRTKDNALGDAWDVIAAAGSDPNIEDILSSVRQMREAILPTDTLAGLDAAGLARLETSIQEAISAEVRPDESRIPSDLPHRALGRWLRKIDRIAAIEIFTTNYDTLLERALEAEGVPLFDGFVGAHRPFFLPSSLARPAMAPGRRWTRLWKIHGSVTWYQPLLPEGPIVRGDEQESGQMILPSLLKYDESRKQPYVAMMDRLGRALADREDSILVTAGYSFGDQHINEVIFEALDANPRLHVFALCFSDPAADSELGRESRRRRNILVFGPRKAIVRGEEGPWLLRDPVRDGPRLDGLFEPDTLGAGASANDPVEGTLKLGDFAVLCSLLGSIAGIDD
jgi:hypothetical protein